MTFKLLLTEILGSHKVFHVMECSVCGHDEVYYKDSKTNKVSGRACQNCNYVQKL
ncbi:MAG: acyltransferase [Bacillus sp. (in: Bacteria)]|nr:acyltransferase [Bacillus sp. (in: firmicutes)]